jgi:hypothetical protein
LFNVDNGKRDVRRATRIATLTIDQSRIESTGKVVNIKGPPTKEGMKAHGIGGGL